MPMWCWLVNEFKRNEVWNIHSLTARLDILMYFKCWRVCIYYEIAAEKSHSPSLSKPSSRSAEIKSSAVAAKVYFCIHWQPIFVKSSDTTDRSLKKEICYISNSKTDIHCTKANMVAKHTLCLTHKILTLRFIFLFYSQVIKPQNGFLGIVLAGGADTPLGHHFVHDVLPNSSASKSGCVRTGDELLQANGQPLTNKTHAEALSIFRSLPAVIELVVARTKDANRSILQRPSNGKKGNDSANKNIASPEKRRSIIEEAAKTSVIPGSLSPVVNVTKKVACPYVKPAKRVCRVSSFLGSEDDKMPTNAFEGRDEVLELKKEPANEGGENKLKEIEKVNQKEKIIRKRGRH